MTKKVFIHGSGHKAASWRRTISCMNDYDDILCPNLASLLDGKAASYDALYTAFANYCSELVGPIHLCGLSLGGILALNVALDFPDKVRSLVLMGTPYKVPKLAFQFQNLIFRLLPAITFETMAFDKTNTFALGHSMTALDFSQRLSDVRCPTLVLCGSKDRANLKSARYLARNISQAELHVLENAGHVLNEECPEALAKILTEFYAMQEGDC